MDEDPAFVDDVTQTAYEAMLTRDWDGLRLLLHPYLHWTTSDGTRIRGRVTVMERLRHAAPPAARPRWWNCAMGRSTVGRSL
jgi:hypothetical protein